MKVSVCIPVYGVEKYIERCARSLFEQTMKEDIEFIFVNDCTKDKSIEILEQVLNKYPERKNQVKIIHHQKNSGLAAARQTGVEHAVGEYIIHCDSDDWVEKDMYETMYIKAKNDNADIVFCGVDSCFANGKKITKKFSCLGSPYELLERICVDHRYASLWNKLYRRRVLPVIQYCGKHLVIQEDFIMNYYALQNSKIISWIDDPFYHYFCNVDSSSQKKWNTKDYEDLMWVLKYISFNAPDERLINYYKLNIQQMLLSHPECVSVDKFDSLTKDSTFVWVMPMPLSKKIFVGLGRINFVLASGILAFLLKIRRALRT